MVHGISKLSQYPNPNIQARYDQGVEGREEDWSPRYWQRDSCPLSSICVRVRCTCVYVCVCVCTSSRSPDTEVARLTKFSVNALNNHESCPGAGLPHAERLPYDLTTNFAVLRCKRGQISWITYCSHGYLDLRPTVFKFPTLCYVALYVWRCIYIYIYICVCVCAKFYTGDSCKSCESQGTAQAEICEIRRNYTR